MRFDLALGLVGCALVLAHHRLWWSVVTSPGDDNPVAIAFVLGALLAILPASSLIAVIRRRRRGWFLRLAGSVAAVVAALPVLVFWRALLP